MTRQRARARRDRVSVLVVGGGISGLSAAHRLSELLADRGEPATIRLVESSGRLGGQVRTQRDGDYLLEAGPDSLVTTKPAGVELCRRLGMEAELLAPRPGPATTEVVRSGRRVALPDGFALVAPTRWAPLFRSSLFSWPGKARIAIEPLLPARPAEAGDESMRSFVQRRFGREVFERAAEPILGGLFTADADRFSIGVAMPRFVELERQHGSVIRGLRKALKERPAGSGNTTSFRTLRDGLGSLIDRLVSRLPEGCLLEGSAAEQLSHNPESKSWRVRLRGRGEIEAEAVVLACPTHVSARLLSGIDGHLSSGMTRVRHASCATVNLAYRRSAIRAPLGSHGFFVPRTERLPILAASLVSAKFDGRAPRDTLLVRTFMGGVLQPEILDRDDAELVRLSHQTLRGLLAIDGEPILATTHRSPNSMPQFPVGYAEQVAAVRKRLERYPGLYVCGGGVGAFGLPDCIRSGEGAAAQAASFLDSRTRELELAI